jgi:uncharacterized protein
VLRGFALLGILISHVPTISGYEFLPPDSKDAVDGWEGGVWLRHAAEFFVRGKFFSLFSLLFGIGFALQIESAARQAVPFARRFVRRMLGLLAIGVAHSLLWFGDILVYYALLGLMLIPMANWDARRMSRVAVGAFSLRFVWALGWFGLAPFLLALAPDSVQGASGEPASGGGLMNLVENFAGTDPTASFYANLDFLKLKLLQMFYDGKFVSVFGMFMLGAAIGKYGIFRHLDHHRLLLRRVFVIAAPVGLVGNAILIPLHAVTPVFPPSALRVLENAVFAVAIPALTLAYASGLSLLWLRPGVQRWLRPFAAPGQMALTTYLTQTLVLTLLFYGWGLGWMFEIGQAECMMVAFLIFASQIFGSRLWFSYFRYGPVEWAWRCSTYGAWLPLRNPAKT